MAAKVAETFLFSRKKKRIPVNLDLNKISNYNNNKSNNNDNNNKNSKNTAKVNLRVLDK